MQQDASPELTAILYCILLHLAATVRGMETTERSAMEQARLAKGWTQRMLAAVVTAAGVSVTDAHLSRIERGMSSPGPGLRKALADALGLKVTDLP